MADERITVVIVDDHQMFAESTARLLEREHDLEVVGIALNVADARRLVADSAPDVAVVDLHLPDGDGAALTGEILLVSPATQVLILTGAAEERLLVAAVAAGCAGFLTKDRAFDELPRAIRRAAHGEAGIPASLLTALLPKFGGTRQGLGANLTNRERAVLELLRAGASTPSIAATEFVSVNTVRNHVHNILTKLNAHSKLEAVAIATREGVFDR